MIFTVRVSGVHASDGNTSLMGRPAQVSFVTSPEHAAGNTDIAHALITVMFPGDAHIEGYERNAEYDVTITPRRK